MPKEIRDLIDRLRSDGATIDEIVEHLAEMDVEVSRSTVGRRVVTIDDLIADARAAKFEVAAIADALKESEGVDVADVTRELLEAEYFKLLKRMREADVDLGPDFLKMMANGLSALSRSKKTEVEMRREAEKAAEAKLRGKLAEAAKTKGMSSETVQLIMDAVLGADG